jgi:hypothetical protein
VAFRSCALVTLAQLFQCDHSEHWVVFLRDGGFLATMLSQLASMLAILWCVVVCVNVMWCVGVLACVLCVCACVFLCL